jgi:hypothetical protein
MPTPDSSATTAMQHTMQTARALQPHSRKEATIAALETERFQRERTMRVSLTATAEVTSAFALAEVVLDEPFRNNRNFWFTGQFSATETISVTDGMLRIHWQGKGASYEVYVEDLVDVIAEVTCRVVAGGRDGGCGIVFGQNREQGFYEFEVYSDYYRLTLYQVGQEPETLLEGNPADVFRPAAANHLRVIRRNDEARLYLNEVLLAHHTDTTFQRGRVGLSSRSYNEEGGVVVEFDDFRLWAIGGE